MQVLLRKVEKTDNETLANLIRQVFLEFDAPHEGTVFSDPTTDSLFELFEKRNSVLWLAVVDNQIAGCCGIYPSDGLPQGCCELVKFYLSKEFRGQGIGKALLNKSIETAIKTGYNRVYLESLPQFDKALKLYENFGFKILNQALGKSKHTGCSVWMEKQI